jgi:hypothetical protein
LGEPANLTPILPVNCLLEMQDKGLPLSIDLPELCDFRYCWIAAIRSAVSHAFVVFACARATHGRFGFCRL